MYENLRKVASIYGIVVEEPQWVQVDNTNSAEDYNKAIRSDVNPKECKIVCVVIFRPELKKGVKSFLDKGGVVSQFITAKKLGGKLSMGVFSNLLKQMNAKLRLDLYRVHLPHFKNTMVVGVNIITNHSRKLIGCCATSTKSLTQCYTRVYNQRMPEVTGDHLSKYPGKDKREV